MISIVIPLYNKAKSIVFTLQSVLVQTYTDYEIVIVDDGSTDGSAEICQDYLSKIKNLQSKIKNIRLLRQRNVGVSAARNAGVLAAKGEFVCFLDADDYWEPSFLEKMAGLIEEFPGKSIYGLGCLHTHGEKRFGSNNQNSYYRGLADWEGEKMAFSGSSACVRKKDAIEIGLFDTRMTHGEDWDMWWRLMLLHGGACDTHPYAYYRQDSENRAMNRAIPLEKHIPYYIDKYAEARATNTAFRRFFDQEMIYRLYPYLLDNKYRVEAKRLAKEFDYSLQKKSMKWRMQCPYLYKMYLMICGR